MKGTSPCRRRHRGAKIEVSVFNLNSRRGSRGKDYYCGHRPGKERVLASWSGCGGQDGAPPHCTTRSAGRGGGGFIALSDWHGSVLGCARVGAALSAAGRSEEHTSELQSPYVIS